jgi:pilus assembly protein FimV
MTRHPLPVGRHSAVRLIPTLSGRGPLSLLSAAIALALGMVATDASALSLGRLNVQSALGEPLRAEIDVAEISAAEADGLKLNIASIDAFRAAGVDYNAALSDVRVALQRRADGRYVVRLNGSRSLNDPFIDLMLEANWGTGRMVRDYTVLLDPQSTRRASAATTQIEPTAPQIGVAPRAAPPVVAQAAPRRQRPAPAPAAAPAGERTVRTGTGDGRQVTVRPGDTASKIAGAYKPADVSLDQMLIALLRNNPDAFVGGNMNRMKAGAVLNVPGASQADAAAPDEAKRIVTAQSRDFNDYRQRLAGNAPTSKVADASRQASGKVQTNVEDRSAAAPSPDRLTISAGAGAKTAEDKLAQARQAAENKARAAELSKNIAELNKLQSAANAPAPAGAAPAAATTPPATPAAPTSAAGTPAVPPSAAVSPSTTPAAPASVAATPALPGVTVPVATPAAVAPADAVPATPPAAAKPAPAKATPQPAPERGFFAELMDNPLMLAGAALIALLIGFLLYRVLGRKRQDAGDSVFLESRMPKDSFFGASGGESVDTKNRSGAVASSLSYSPSQLDTGDVDPVAEADVYLAYGRDLQAEEILREALRSTPERTAIHLKLLEIYAKRRDLRAYEALAADVHKLTGGAGNEWNRVIEMGRDLDPGNPLYQHGMRAPMAVAAAADLSAATPIDLPTMPIVPEPVAPPPAFVPSVAPLDFDLDLSKPAPAVTAPAPLPPTASLPPAATTPDTTYERTVRGARGNEQEIDLENDFDTAPAALEPVNNIAMLPDEVRTQPATLRAGLPGDSGFIEFDMGSLTGRTPLETEPGRLEGLDDSGDNSPHAIKLSLARELQAIGDVEGARSLMEEVAAEASGDLKAKARQLLTQLA